jgi:bifunctional enzyme CysN/CysC/sulfate adenylyltransferase subunit 1
VVTVIEHRVDIRTYAQESDVPELGMNDIGEIRLRTARPLVYDGYSTNRLTGSFIIVDPGSNQTVGAGMLRPPSESFAAEYEDFSI